MQTEVGDLLNYAVASGSTITTTQVKRDLNTAKDIVFNRLVSLGQDYNARLTKADLVADQSLYGLPSDCRKILRVEVGYETSSDRFKARRMDGNEENDPVYTTYVETSPRYVVRGSNIELKPTPSSNVTDGLQLLYVEDLADMTDNTDTSGLPFEYDYLLTLYAAGKGKYKLGLAEEGNNYMAQFRLGLDDMEQQVIERNLDDSPSIIIRDEYGGL